MTSSSVSSGKPGLDIQPKYRTSVFVTDIIRRETILGAVFLCASLFLLAVHLMFVVFGAFNVPAQRSVYIVAMLFLGVWCFFRLVAFERLISFYRSRLKNGYVGRESVRGAIRAFPTALLRPRALMCALIILLSIIARALFIRAGFSYAGVTGAAFCLIAFGEAAVHFKSVALFGKDMFILGTLRVRYDAVTNMLQNSPEGDYIRFTMYRGNEKLGSGCLYRRDYQMLEQNVRRASESVYGKR
jgi:hypothetical protein